MTTASATLRPPPIYVKGDELKAHRAAANAADQTAELTLRQFKFVQNFAANPVANAAAVAAGYSPKSAGIQASVLLANPKIVAAIDAELAKSAQRLALSQDMVLRGLKREAEYAGPGASHAARVRAWELLGRTMGMMTEQTAIIGSDGKPVDRFAPVILQVIRNG